MTETRFEKILSSYIPLPMCIVNNKGKIVRSNSHIDEVFIYDGIEDADFFALTGIKIATLYEGEKEDKDFIIERNGKAFKLLINREGNEEEANLLVFFYDITNYENLKDRYEEERVCVCRIDIDNYDELIASTAADKRMGMSTTVDKLIRNWASDMAASIIKTKEYEYMMYIQNRFVDEMIKKKFAILDDVRAIETESDFPMSLSIGVGVGGDTLEETAEYATAAMDLALGRGGDQAVVKNGNKINYFGGIMQTVEKSNKGKSRVVAHALKQLIEQSPKVMIMGHKNADMDAFGSALGIFRLCQMYNKEAVIVIDSVNDSLHDIYKLAEESEKYKFVNNCKALNMVERDCLLIVLDTHRRSYVECEELLDKIDRKVVIDHHRRVVDSIENPTLLYVESYASSTAELVSEILQYSGQKRILVKLEAEALLAGMTIDTNRFAVKTGVRTFEAAAWLRRSGADTTEVKRLFQTDLEAFKVRAKCIAAAEIMDNGVATSVCEGCNEDAQVINSQVADELLNIKGVKATFVSGRDEHGNTVISARSLGAVNVQVIMEKIGGGGHLTTAGAQVMESPEEIIESVKKILEKDIKL